MDELNLHPLSLEPKPQAQTACQVKRPARSPRELGFHELQQRLEQGSLYPDGSESTQTNGCQPISKDEMQIAKIVQKVKKGLSPDDISEQEIRKHVDDVRYAQGGFSYMSLNSIVAMVLSHIKNVTQVNN